MCDVDMYIFSIYHLRSYQSNHQYLHMQCVLTVSGVSGLLSGKCSWLLDGACSDLTLHGLPASSMFISLSAVIRSCPPDIRRCPCSKPCNLRLFDEIPCSDKSHFYSNSYGGDMYPAISRGIASLLPKYGY